MVSKKIFPFLSEFIIRTEILSFAFDVAAVQNIDLNSEDEVLAVFFCGNLDAYRASIINLLLENGIEVHLYGNDWSKYVNHELAVIHNLVYELEFYKILRKYHVQLNVMRVHYLNSHNMRSMKIPGIDDVMLAPHTADHSTFFNFEQEIFFTIMSLV